MTISGSVATAVIDLLRLITRLLYVLGLLGNCSFLGSRALDDFVKFTPVKPDTPAFRAIIDLNPLTIRHDEVNGSTNWAFHGESSLVLLIHTQAASFGTPEMYSLAHDIGNASRCFCSKLFQHLLFLVTYSQGDYIFGQNLTFLGFGFTGFISVLFFRIVHGY
jgi:hypothetical protein